MTIGRLCLAALALSSSAAAAPPTFDTPAPVAYLIDLSSGAELIAKGADRPIPPASMAKMMTTEVAFEAIDAGELALAKPCIVRPETWRKWHGPAAGSTMFLSPGERVSVENLLHGIVTLSGNDASVVLAECIAGSEPAFAARMNALAAKLGLAASHFGNSNGWPDEGVTRVTARDLARLARATIERHPKLYKQFYGQPSFTWGRTLGQGAPITQGNRNPLLGRIAGADGLKTGHTAEAGYSFTGSAEQNGRRLVMVIAGLASASQRIAESVRLMRWGFEQWSARQLFAAGARLGSARVQLGEEDEVSLIAPRNLAITLPAASAAGVRLRIAYRGPLKAPIARGQHVADLIVAPAGFPAQRLPLVAGEAVGEAGLFRRAWIGLTQLLGLG